MLDARDTGAIPAERPDLGAVILAAGAGTRLGGVAKALLRGPDGRTFLAAIVETAREVGLVEPLVVVGPPHGDAVTVVAHGLGCRVVLNPAPERGMASSVALGFGSLSPKPRAAWLWPVDHPDVSPATLRILIAALGFHAAARPVYESRGGHPPLIARPLWSALASCADVEGGARTVLAGADVADVEVGDRGVVRDVDTPADLEVR